MTAETIVASARACVGAAFRPWGRDPAYGLDCVGLAARALGLEAPRDYALRGGDGALAARMIGAAGLVVVDRPRAGDLLLLLAGPGQLHLAIHSGTGFVHADARLRRIVETPGVPEMALLGTWRREG